jgi:hypothetical protein
MWVQPEHYQILGTRLAATRRQLAARLHRPQSLVSDLETGKRRIDLVEFLLIVRTLGMEPVTTFSQVASSIKPFARLPLRWNDIRCSKPLRSSRRSGQSKKCSIEGNKIELACRSVGDTLADRTNVGRT